VLGDFEGAAVEQTSIPNRRESGDDFRESGRSGRRPPYSRDGRDRRDSRSQALTVYVDERGIEPALRAFKKLVAKEGLLKDLKRRQSYEKPGARKRRKQREASRRRRRQEARINRRFH